MTTAKDNSLFEGSETEKALGALNTDSSTVDELDELMSELNAEAQGKGSDENDEALEDEALKKVEVQTIRKEALESQAKNTTKVTDVVEPKTTKKKAAKKKDGDEAPKAKRVSTAGMTKAQATTHKLGDDRYDVLILDTDMAKLPEKDRKAQIDKFIASFDEQAKKVAEKAMNIACSLNNSDRLSNYTRMAIDLLKEKGEMTTADLRSCYLDRPYTPGTASAQSSQMFKLLPLFKIAIREGNTLKLNPDSVIADSL